MTELLSCAERTVHHAFPTLDTIQTIEHTNDDPNDFYFFGETQQFLHFNQCDLKLFTFRANEFRSIRKYRKAAKEFTCFSCVKNGQSLFACGTESGKINLYNCLRPKLDVEKSFSPSVPSKVVDLDYSYCNKYLSAVYDDGRINVFGLQTRVKLNELPVDSRHMPMVARFFTSPNIKLAIGAYTGKFSVHDLVVKTKIFESSNAHKDFCCDIICPLSHPNSIISAGDCTINIYDLRKKKRTKCQTVLHPISTITMSQCGTYLVAGDKAGEIVGYDMRSMKVPLISMCIAGRPISRVAFVPPRNDTKTSACSIYNVSESGSEENTLEERAANENDAPDSFFDFGNANPRVSDVLSDSNMFTRLNRYSLDFESRSSIPYKGRDVLNEVSNQQMDLTSSFVTHRRKSNIRKSIIPVALVPNVIQEESESIGEFNAPKTPPKTDINNKSPAVDMKELNAINSKLVALEDGMTAAMKDIDNLFTKLPAFHVDLHSLTGTVMRSCNKQKKDQNFNLETKLQLIDLLGHGEHFQQCYDKMIDDAEQDSLRIQKILHPKMFQD